LFPWVRVGCEWKWEDEFVESFYWKGFRRVRGGGEAQDRWWSESEWCRERKGVGYEGEGEECGELRRGGWRGKVFGREFAYTFS